MTVSSLLAGFSVALPGQGQLLTRALGTLHLPSGYLTIVDPFAHMVRGGNMTMKFPPGNYDMITTRLRYTPTFQEYGPSLNIPGVTDQDESLKLPEGFEAPQTHIQSSMMEEAAYVTLIVNPILWEQRQAWIQTQLKQQTASTYPYFIPKESCRYLHLTHDGYMPSGLDQMNDQHYQGISIDSGTCAWVDDRALIESMPPNQPGHDWNESLFVHGVPGSWFDALDAHEPLPSGMANLKLPKFSDYPKPNNIILVQSGTGEGCFAVVGEYAFDFVTQHMKLPPQLVAIHLDFQMLDTPKGLCLAQNQGPR